MLNGHLDAGGHRTSLVVTSLCRNYVSVTGNGIPVGTVTDANGSSGSLSLCMLVDSADWSV